MSIKKPLTKEFYNRLFVFSNALLIFSTVIFIIYLIFPLLGAELSTRALMCYGSWILIAIFGRIIFKRVRRELRFRAYDYLTMSFVCIINILVWFSYPTNVIFSILTVVGMAVSYRAWAKNNAAVKNRATEDGPSK